MSVIRKQVFAILILTIWSVGIAKADYTWSEEYATSYDYAEVNDMCALLGTGGNSDQVLLVGGAWNNHPRQNDAKVVLIGLDPTTGSEDFERYISVWQYGAIAYGACVNEEGNYLVTGACNMGNSYSDDFTVPFILEVDTNGSVLDTYYPDPEPRWNPQTGFDIIEHSNGDYYIVGGANAGYQDYIFVARYNTSFRLLDYYTYYPHGESHESWTYANTICEIPSGYSSEGGWVVVAFTQSMLGFGPCLAVLDEDLNEITVRDFSFHCWESGTGSS